MKKKIFTLIFIIFIILGIFGGVIIHYIIKYKASSIKTITRYNAAKLITMALIDDENINNALPIELKDVKQTDWYAQYVYASYEAGYFDNQESFLPEDEFTYADGQYLADKLGLDTSRLSYSLSSSNKPMPSEKFYELYDLIIEKSSLENKVQKSNLMLLDFDSEDNKYVTQNNIYSTTELDLSSYKDRNFVAYTKNSEILAVTSEKCNEININNCYLVSADNEEVTCFINGIYKSFPININDTDGLAGVVANLKIIDGKVEEIVRKPDVICAKVLSIDNDNIELEGYGKLPVSNDYKIYKIYGDLEMERTSNILIGYKITSFIIADGKIEASLITEPIIAENIRVMINSTGFTSLFHDNVIITSTDDFKMYYGDSEAFYKANDIVTIEKNSEYLASGRVRFETSNENGKLKIMSIERGSGNPEYRGSIEVALYDDGLTIINDLSIEEYLYAVVPSEMPTNYGEEALKVQAVCARSYAYSHLNNNDYGKYGAHLDDSVNSQVYNNSPENEHSIYAVKDTYGKAMFYDDLVVYAYFFSTSCGVTSNSNDVWLTTKNTPNYLVGCMQTPEGGDFDFSQEEEFRSFIDNPDQSDYFEREYPMFRWNTTITIGDIKDSIDNNLENRINANPEFITVLNGQGEYEQKVINTIGEITNITITSRGKSGIAKEAIIEGSENTIRVQGEYNIRTLISPFNAQINKCDGTVATGWKMLPSGYFYVNPISDNGNVTSFSFIGGGYGHGVGMSQNGVKVMVTRGYTVYDILLHYYPGVEFRNIYEQ